MYHHLTREQRYAIYLGLQAKKSLKSIAGEIGVHPATVGREVRRNLGRSGEYGWKVADEISRCRIERIPGNGRIRADIVREAISLLVREDWSPKQISGHLARKGIHISHETIYKIIRADPTGELRGHCRHGMKYRRHAKYRKRETKSTIIDRVSIHDRPPEADGTRFGDWEMDLIMGKGNRGAILTLCERNKNYLMMEKLPRGRNAEDVAKAVVGLLWPYRRNVLSITTDNGTEFACHKTIAKELSTSVYFTDSFASWQKGAIENMNKLIRQYIPKGTDFKDIDDEYVRSVQYRINRRPREKLNFSTPKDEFFKSLL